MTTWFKSTVGLFAVAAALAMAIPAIAAGNTQIRGVAQYDESCDAEPGAIPSQFTMRLTGDLVGCWYTPGWDVTVSTPSGVYQERGTEKFVGCFADGTGCGTFETTYTFTAKYAADGSQLHGRCQHPIVKGSGTGVFEGATGRLDFKDDVDCGVAHYRGHIKLN